VPKDLIKKQDMKFKLFNYKTFSWKKYIFETLSIFIAVVSAFALSNWSQNLRDDTAEIEILKEVKNAIQNDLYAIKFNKDNNAISKKSCTYMRELINNKEVKNDSLVYFYVMTFRDYSFTGNTTGYKGLESKGLDILDDNLLRTRISYYYNYYFKILEKIEGESDQHLAFKNYFFKFNDKLFPFMVFDDDGQLLNFDQPILLSESEKKELLSYLWMLENDRANKIMLYEQLEEQLKIVEEQVNKVLEEKLD
jgi:hypothetical protein